MFIQAKIREVKMDVDYNPYVADIQFSIRKSSHNELVSTYKELLEYNPARFGDGVHFIWEF